MSGDWLILNVVKFELTYGGPDTNFSTFRINESPEMFLNIELQEQIIDKTKSVDNEHFRIIFHTDDVDALYYYLRNDDYFSRLGKFETKPTDAEWEERFFQVRDPDGHPIVFATPISKND